MEELYQMNDAQLTGTLLGMHPKLGKAVALAEKYHKGQTRKCELQANGVEQPYLVHPLRVAIIVSKYTDDLRVIEAAVLHDILEDTTCPSQDIERKFGSTVLDLVGQLTKPRGMEGNDAKYWQLGYYPYMDEDAQIIKLADRLDNLISSKGTRMEARTTLWSRRLLSIASQFQYGSDGILRLVEKLKSQLL
jgi:(p)ppGpp synthase/HD superfamily hydrolase